jgi:intracellular sulfur oxidation DsrE/DsrF family protein
MKPSYLKMSVPLLAIVLSLACGSAWAQSKAGDLAVPGEPVAQDLPGAHELPSKSTTYKVVFDVGKAAPKEGDVNPMLETVARYINTLAKYGVPADHRKIAVVFHQGGTPIIQNNEAYKASHQGKDNPDLALIQKLKAAGVDFRVCGQAVLAYKIDPKTITPEIQLDLWALTTLIDFQLQGYVHIGG